MGVAEHGLALHRMQALLASDALLNACLRLGHALPQRACPDQHGVLPLSKTPPLTCGLVVCSMLVVCSKHAAWWLRPMLRCMLAAPNVCLERFYVITMQQQCMIISCDHLMHLVPAG
jgi:hypothetical protein